MLECNTHHDVFARSFGDSPRTGFNDSPVSLTLPMPVLVKSFSYTPRAGYVKSFSYTPRTGYVRSLFYTTRAGFSECSEEVLLHS